jgi:uncharacterized membrane protein
LSRSERSRPACLRAIAAGVLVGAASAMRSQMGLAIVVNGPDRAGLPAFWRRVSVRRGAAVAAVGELVGDQLPMTPDRTSPGPYAGRIVIGGLAGGLLAASRRRAVVPGVVAAAVAAAVVTPLSHSGRAAAARHMPAPVAAVLEDVLAVTLAWGATRA